MPESSIQATPMNNLVLLTGTVASPDDVSEAQRLVQAYVGTTTQVVSRIRSATPLQVTLRVKIAEVSRSLVRQIGVNLLASDSTGGFNFGVGQGGLDQPRQRARSPSPAPAPCCAARASCSGSTCSARSSWPKATGSSPRWPNRA